MVASTLLKGIFKLKGKSRESNEIEDQRKKTISSNGDGSVDGIEKENNKLINEVPSHVGATSSTNIPHNSKPVDVDNESIPEDLPAELKQDERPILPLPQHNGQEGMEVESIPEELPPKPPDILHSMNSHPPTKGPREKVSTELKRDGSNKHGIPKQGGDSERSPRPLQEQKNISNSPQNKNENGHHNEQSPKHGDIKENGNSPIDKPGYKGYQLSKNYALNNQPIPNHHPKNDAALFEGANVAASKLIAFQDDGDDMPGDDPLSPYVPPPYILPGDAHHDVYSPKIAIPPLPLNTLSYGLDPQSITSPSQYHNQSYGVDSQRGDPQSVLSPGHYSKSQSPHRPNGVRESPRRGPSRQGRIYSPERCGPHWSNEYSPRRDFKQGTEHSTVQNSQEILSPGFSNFIHSPQDSQDRPLMSELSTQKIRSHRLLPSHAQRIDKLSNKGSPRRKGKTHFTELKELLAEAKMWLDTTDVSQKDVQALVQSNEEGRIFLLELTHQSEELPLHVSTAPMLVNAKKTFCRLKQEHWQSEKMKLAQIGALEKLDQQFKDIEDERKNLIVALRQLRNQNRLEANVDDKMELTKFEKDVAILKEKAIYLKNYVVTSQNKLRKKMNREKFLEVEVKKLQELKNQQRQKTPESLNGKEQEHIQSEIKLLERQRAENRHSYRLKLKSVEEKMFPVNKQIVSFQEKLRKMTEQLFRDKNAIQYHQKLDRERRELIKRLEEKKLMDEQARLENGEECTDDAPPSMYLNHYSNPSSPRTRLGTDGRRHLLQDNSHPTSLSPRGHPQESSHVSIAQKQRSASSPQSPGLAPSPSRERLRKGKGKGKGKNNMKKEKPPPKEETEKQGPTFKKSPSKKIIPKQSPPKIPVQKNSPLKSIPQQQSPPPKLQETLPNKGNTVSNTGIRKSSKTKPKLPKENPMAAIARRAVAEVVYTVIARLEFQNAKNNLDGDDKLDEGGKGKDVAHDDSATTGGPHNSTGDSHGQFYIANGATGTQSYNANSATGTQSYNANSATGTQSYSASDNM